MADIVIFVINTERNGSDELEFDVTAQVICNEGSGNPHQFTVQGLNFNATALAINEAIRDGAIAKMAAAESITVGALDTKRLFAGAMGI